MTTDTEPAEPADKDRALELIKHLRDKVAAQQRAAEAAEAQRVADAARPMPDVARELAQYLLFHSDPAQVFYQEHLAAGFFQEHLDKGVTEFFGISVDDRGIVADSQQPALLARFRTLQTLRSLAFTNRLYATIDVNGYPFHCVMTVTEKSDRPGVYVLWLDPTGRDDDLTTPMPGEGDDITEEKESEC